MDPDLPVSRHVVTSSLRRDRIFDLETWSGRNLVTESRPDNPMDSLGPAPMELMLAALASCAGGTFTSMIEKMRHQPQDVRVLVSGRRSGGSPKVWDSIHFKIVVRSDLPPKRLARALELTERSCPASAMLDQVTELTGSAFLLSPPDTAAGISPRTESSSPANQDISFFVSDTAGPVAVITREGELQGKAGVDFDSTLAEALLASAGFDR